MAGVAQRAAAAGSGRLRGHDAVPTPGSQAPAASAPGSLLGRAATAARIACTRTAWYLNGMLGADAYQRYVEHQRRAHPAEPLLSEREFWRERSAEQGRNPGARCC